MTSQQPALGTIDARTLRGLIDSRDENAVLDVREEGVFSRGHLFCAVCVPLSQLELRIERLVPRKATKLVLCDDDGVLAARAAARLRVLGYSDLCVLASGILGWKNAGFELFTGINVPSKAFGEHVEHHESTPSLSAEELKQHVDAGTDMVILDSRPMGEFNTMSIPGAIDCPGAELVYRVHEVAPSAERLVVVNCAGRTRSIIGAQSLINAGIPNRVLALRNGTMGWHLAGLKLAHGKTDVAPLPGPVALDKARAAAARVAKRFGVRFIDTAQLERLRREATTRTLYCLDVRDPPEYERGHLAEFDSAPGGQLVQATDHYMATRNARVVLADDDGVRATMTASWLNQMGLPEVCVLQGVAPGEFRTKTAAASIPGLVRPVPPITPRDLQDKLRAGEVSLIDLATSLQYRKAHIDGAQWAIRARLDANLARIDLTRPVVMTSPDGRLAQLAAQDMRELSAANIFALEGGTHAWIAAGLPTTSGEGQMLDAPEDIWYRPYDRKDSVENSMRDYLSWEVELIEQIKREGVRYPVFPPE